ncbi:MAG TPA: NAD(P)-dependent oxidoreductase [Phycisphaerae bacterium]|nr:NAD(P)-dependent oxidoreductase [Phycisphaerae bacterium]
MKGTRPYKIVVAESFDAPALARLREIGSVHVLENCSPESILAEIPGAHALLVRGKAHVTARIIDAAPELKVIGRASPSIDHIDLKAAKRRQISIVYTPHVAVNSMAQFALGLILCLQRRIGYLDSQVRDGKFDTLRSPFGRELGLQTLGLYGTDPVGQTVARGCAAAFGTSILYHDPAQAKQEELADVPGEAATVERLQKECDIISVHLSGSRDAKLRLDGKFFEKMKPTAVLINISRGSAINTVDLAQALRRRTIAGAALDVFELEPLQLDHPLRSAPNCVLTPHVAGATVDANSQRSSVIEDVARVLQGESPRFGFEMPDGSPAKKSR